MVLTSRELGQTSKRSILVDALRQRQSGRYVDEMVAAASAIEQLQLDDRTFFETCGALTSIERLWRLYLEHSTLRNFDRIYPAISDQFGALNCAGVSPPHHEG